MEQKKILQLKFRPKIKQPINNIKLDQKFPVSQQENAIAIFLSQNKKQYYFRADTGSGKSTIIPQIIYKYFNKKVVIIQPRRIAAISLATYLNCDYMVRFDQKINNSNYLYITDGLFLKLANKFKDYWIIIDEAHERTSAQDLIRGYCISQQLNFIVTSATQTQVNNEMYIEGKTYPVQTIFNQKPQDYMIYTKQTSLQIVIKLFIQQYDTLQFQKYQQKHGYQINNIKIDLNQYIGNILIFLPGQDDINCLIQYLKQLDNFLSNFYTFIDKKRPYNLEILPLHSQLTLIKQNLIFKPESDDTIKIIVATNIAETSLTIPNVSIVLDSSMQKTLYYDYFKHSDSLILEDISQASFSQRKGRAGRVRNGIYFSRYTEEQFKTLKLNNLPEIKRIRLEKILCDLILLLTDNSVDLSINIKDITSYPFPDSPDDQLILHALINLRRLRFILFNDNIIQLTEFGLKNLKLSLDPELAFFVSIAGDYQQQAIKICSFIVSGCQITKSDGFTDDFQQTLKMDLNYNQSRISQQLQQQAFKSSIQAPTIAAAFAAATQNIAYYNPIYGKYYKWKDSQAMVPSMNSNVINLRAVTYSSLSVGKMARMNFLGSLTDQDIDWADQFK